MNNLLKIRKEMLKVIRDRIEEDKEIKTGEIEEETQVVKKVEIEETEEIEEIEAMIPIIEADREDLELGEKKMLTKMEMLISKLLVKRREEEVIEVEEEATTEEIEVMEVAEEAEYTEGIEDLEEKSIDPMKMEPPNQLNNQLNKINLQNDMLTKCFSSFKLMQ